MSNVQILYVGNDMVLELDGLKDDVSGNAANNADVSVTLFDEQGAPVEGGTWPQSLVHVSGGNGLYRTTLPYTLTLTQGRRYTATVVADAGPGLHAEWEMEVMARHRN